jgi:molybdenum cofactor guanylyltransferase
LSLPVESGVDGAEGFVLAGGRSSRMGTDKALVQLGGELLIARAVGILRDAGLPVTIAGARSTLSEYAPTIEDAGDGPLSGICSALASTRAQYAVFLSVDMPLIPASLIRVLVDYARLMEAAVVFPSVNGFVETFPCVADRAVLPLLEFEAEAGNTGCRSALRAAAARLEKPLSIVRVENLVQSGHIEHSGALSPAFWFLNVNTPADLARAETMIGFDRVS